MLFFLGLDHLSPLEYITPLLRDAEVAERAARRGALLLSEALEEEQLIKEKKKNTIKKQKVLGAAVLTSINH